MRYKPYIIYVISLLILWSITLQSKHLIGTDIHLEYYFLNLSQVNGWDYALPITYNGALPVALIAPFIANILHIDGLWLLKIAFPMVFALVPVLLYLIYKEYFSEKISLLAVLFFISMPAFFMEISGNAKQMIGETLLVLCIYLIIKKKKLWMIVLTCILVVLSHYTMAFLLLAMLCIGMVVLLIKKQSVKTLVIASATIAITGFFYYSWVGGGILMHVLNNQLPFNIPLLTVLAKDVNTPETVLPITIGNDLVKMAFGSDFLHVSTLGKIFRLLQYTTQALIVVGAIWIVVKNRMSYFVAFFIACGCILGLWVVIPSLSGVIDIPRLYHVVLIMLSPALVIGGQYIFRNLRYVSLLIAVYFMFTSGAVFEVAKTETMDIPSSVAFSNDRIDLGGTMTEDDVIVRDYIKMFDLTPVYADWYGLLLLKERFGVASTEVLEIPRYYIPEGSYVFLRSRNDWDCEIVTWSGVGQREYRRYGDIDLSDMELIYESGISSVWRV